MYLSKWGNFAVVLAACMLSFDANAWIVKIDCNEGRDGETVTRSSALNNFTDAAGGIKYTTNQYVEGGVACKMQIEKGATGFGRWGGRKKLPSKLYKGSEIWIRVHTYFPQDFDYNSSGAGNRLKFLRVHTRSQDRGEGGSCVETNEGYNDWYIYPTTKLFGDAPFGFIKECHGVWKEFGSFRKGISITKGEWETYEMYLKLDNVPASKGGAGLVRVWRNNELLGEFRNVPTLSTPDSYADSFLMFTYWNGGAPKTQHMYMDDLVVTNEVPGSFDRFGNPRVGVGSITLSSPPESPAANILVR